MPERLNNDKSLESIFSDIVGYENVLINEPMCYHTSFKIGGAADFFLRPSDEAQLVSLINCLSKNKIPYFVIGNGTNLLFSDNGYRGAVVQLSDNFSDFHIDGDIIVAQSGTRLSVLGKAALKYGLTGIEFAAGIPGTIGGAVAMNAGAYGSEMKDIVERTECLDMEGNSIVLTGDEHGFGHRVSRISNKGFIVVKTFLRLKKGSKEKIRKTMYDFSKRRREKQPLEMPSAGSVFKRPPGHFAGKLIQDCGLGGYKIGGAKVSEKHCGFIVNTGEATSEDVTRLIDYIKEKVYGKFGVKLETEIKYVSR